MKLFKCVFTISLAFVLFSPATSEATFGGLFGFGGCCRPWGFGGYGLGYGVGLGYGFGFPGFGFPGYGFGFPGYGGFYGGFNSLAFGYGGGFYRGGFGFGFAKSGDRPSTAYAEKSTRGLNTNTSGILAASKYGAASRLNLQQPTMKNKYSGTLAQSGSRLVRSMGTVSSDSNTLKAGGAVRIGYNLASTRNTNAPRTQQIRKQTAASSNSVQAPRKSSGTTTTQTQSKRKKGY
jgi:hypothetical protein